MCGSLKERSVEYSEKQGDMPREERPDTDHVECKLAGCYQGGREEGQK